MGKKANAETATNSNCQTYCSKRYAEVARLLKVATIVKVARNRNKSLKSSVSKRCTPSAMAPPLRGLRVKDVPSENTRSKYLKQERSHWLKF